MKRCPECRRDYFDETLLYCLDDGERLVDGPGPPDDERATAIFADLPEVAPTKELTERFPGNALSNRNFVIAAAALVVLLAGAGYWYYVNREGEQISSIAVLPFVNGSGNADLDYLSDGLSESVIDRLSRLEQLKVIARSSSFRYRGENPDLRAIAKELGVQALVTGRVIPRGDGYSIRVELIDARESKQLWGDNFTRNASDLQLLQTDISRLVAENLRLRLTGSQSGLLLNDRPTNPQAYEMLLKGRFWFNKAGTANFGKAAEAYEQAVAADPGYALAYSELSQTYNTLGGGPTSSAQTRAERQRLIQKAGEAARNALNLDDNLAEAHYAMAVYKFNTWEWQEAEQSFKRAFELSPNLVAPQVLSGYGGYLSTMKRHDEAIAEVKRVIEVSPISLIYMGSAVVINLHARRYEDAIAASKRRLELDRTLPVPLGRQGEVYEAMGLNEEAAASYKEAIRLQGGELLGRESIFLGALYARMGDRSRADEILKELEGNRERVLPTYLARLYEALGRRDEAIAELEKAYAERLATLPLINIDPAFDTMRPDPRFQDLVRRMGLPQ